ncbi:MAG: NTP transferase domain-containing protein, partial [Bacteriovoracaceae bacterium]
MQIDYCLILSAGFGTRMGEIGKSLPKVLWPIFEKTLLELQVEYAKSIGAKKIFINVHHQKEQILSFCKNKPAFEDVTFLVEEEILDIGGGIHNLAKSVGYKGNLLILNADQFFLMSKDFLEASLKKLTSSPVLLFSYQVDPRLGYNCLELTPQNTLKAIIPAADLKNTSSGVTYTGISLIDLSKISAHSGKSSFFESVASFKNRDILVESVGNIDYWDFGTAQRYWLTMRRVIATYKVNSIHPFLRFLVNSKALKSWKINHNHLSY